MKFNTQVQNKINKNFITNKNATPGFVQLSSKHNEFMSMLPVVKNTIVIIKKTIEITKYINAGGQSLFNIPNEDIIQKIMYILYLRKFHLNYLFYPFDQ
jgi:hypothetical protein